MLLHSKINRISSKRLSPLTEIYYPIAKSRYIYSLYRKERTFDHSPIFIYQMGKVASKSIYISLKKFIDYRNIYHFHILNPESINEHLDFRKKYGPPYKKENFSMWWKAEYIYKLLADKSSGIRHKIITLVREPVSHNVSTFFQNCTYVKTNNKKQYKLKSEWYGFEILLDETSINKLSEVFLIKSNPYYTLRYFDKEFRDNLGIDLYKKSFPKSKGYEIYQYRNFDILLIKYEMLQGCISKAIAEFLDIDDFKLLKINITHEKNYGKIYELFKTNLIVPDRIINESYSSKYAKHFYSDGEISAFKRKWANRSCT